MTNPNLTENEFTADLGLDPSTHEIYAILGKAMFVLDCMKPLSPKQGDRPKGEECDDEYQIRNRADGGHDATRTKRSWKPPV